jgi:hypothetical protein
MGANKN